MLSLRTGDVAFCQGTIVLTLRETKMGQRIGVTQETVVDDPWVVPRLRHAVRSTASGQLLLGMTPARFRAMWKAARDSLRLPQHYTPYSLRRGGATAMFSLCGSFDRVADVGRWGFLSACRKYITTGLQEVASAEDVGILRTTVTRHTRYLRLLGSDK